MLRLVRYGCPAKRILLSYGGEASLAKVIYRGVNPAGLRGKSMPERVELQEVRPHIYHIPIIAD